MVESVNAKVLAKKNEKGNEEEAAKQQKEDVDRVAKNVFQYINMKEGGHHMYGIGYMFCQVRFFFFFVLLLQLNTHVFVSVSHILNFHIPFLSGVTGYCSYEQFYLC